MTTRANGDVLETATPFLVVDLSPYPVELPKGLPRATEIQENYYVDVYDGWRREECHSFAFRILSTRTPLAYAVVTTLVLALIPGMLTRNCQDSALAMGQPSKQRQPEVLEEPDDLVTEAWPWVQSIMDWSSWLNLYYQVRQKVVLEYVPHPLVRYATRVVPHLSAEELELAYNVLNPILKLPEKKEILHLSLIQAIQDYCPPLPIAILPSSSTATSVRHSCLPNSVWDWNHQKRQLRLIALYDLDSDEGWTISKVEGDTFQERQTSFQQVFIGAGACHCVRCHSERNTLAFPTNVRDVIRLGHLHFQRERLEDALSCYRHAVQIDASLDDVWHAIGAVLLTQNKFLQAQRHWRDAVEKHEFLKQNAGISLQLTKQEAYGYFKTAHRHETSTKTVVDQPDFKSYFDGKCFMTFEPVVCREQCLQIIQWADSLEWTASRHYAVPTCDVPVHAVPLLLAWFNQWMVSTIRPLLSKQFGIMPEHMYCHDAFVVRYKATRSSNFLPVHVDESTHSLVLALNDDFEGGGTYFCDYQKTVAPRKSGCLVSFRGSSLRHGGNAVISGTRYILAVFLYHDPPPSRKRLLPSKPRGEKSFSFGFQL
jgi:tetratricopeptide (TPR) repeat protein